MKAPMTRRNIDLKTKGSMLSPISQTANNQRPTLVEGQQYQTGKKTFQSESYFSERNGAFPIMGYQILVEVNWRCYWWRRCCWCVAGGRLPATHLNGFHPSLVKEGYISRILGMRSKEARVVSGGLPNSSMVRACSCVPPTMRVLYVPKLFEGTDWWICFCPCNPSVHLPSPTFIICFSLLTSSRPSPCRCVRVFGMIYSPASNTDSKDASPSRSFALHNSIFWPRTYEKGNSWPIPQRGWMPTRIQQH